MIFHGKPLEIAGNFLQVIPDVQPTVSTHGKEQSKCVYVSVLET